MPVGDIFPELALVVGAGLVVLLASFAPLGAQRWCAALAGLTLAISAALLSRQIGAERLTFQGVWAIDDASVAARLAILAATGFVVLLTPAWLASDKRHGEHYAILLFAALGAMALAGAADLLQLVMAVLLSSVTGYTLAAWHRDWPLSVEAGMKYFLVGALANVVLVLGVILVFGLTGESGVSGLAAALADPARASPLLTLGLALVVAGLAFKLAAVPLHAWLPDVAEGAPAPAAAFLTVAPKIGAAVALARLVDLLPPDGDALRPLIAILAAATMTLGNLAALRQEDVRRLIGWSSVSQSGYALMAIAVVSVGAGATGALIGFLLAYAAANLAAFAVVAHLRGLTERAHYAGLLSERPLVGATLVIAFLSLVGVPPLAGFFGKLGLFLVTIEGGHAWLAVVAAANTALSLAYYLRVVAPMAFGEPKRPRATLSRGSALAVGLGAALVVGLGLAAEPWQNALAGARLLP
ncbi:NADH-quinone oxidoreductase subunit N [Salinarimonas sp.]|uniref:NADH-quinone oxidoreductase subunit N n=1 Tax=Salinarimonas sp. TaxID=2766526 RepID=UPI0032D98668